MNEEFYIGKINIREANRSSRHVKGSRERSYMFVFRRYPKESRTVMDDYSAQECLLCIAYGWNSVLTESIDYDPVEGVTFNIGYEDTSDVETVRMVRPTMFSKIPQSVFDMLKAYMPDKTYLMHVAGSKYQIAKAMYKIDRPWFGENNLKKRWDYDRSL